MKKVFIALDTFPSKKKPIPYLEAKWVAVKAAERFVLLLTVHTFKHFMYEHQKKTQSAIILKLNKEHIKIYIELQFFFLSYTS